MCDNIDQAKKKINILRMRKELSPKTVEILKIRKKCDTDKFENSR